jgi:hypothetical protein
MMEFWTWIKMGPCEFSHERKSFFLFLYLHLIGRVYRRPQKALEVELWKGSWTSTNVDPYQCARF